MSKEVSISFPPWVCGVDGGIDLLKWDIEFHILYGGRAAGRSYSVGLALLLTGMQKPRKVLCAREFQSSIAESVHSQLASIIRNHGMEHFYRIEKTQIKGINGSIFSFTGLAVNPERIKSFEGYDDCWVEEADSVRRDSWAILTPTIRKPGRRFFICFNPSFESSTTYQLFVKNPPPNSRLYHATYLENPFLSKELLQEAQRARLEDYTEYSNIWLGQPRASLTGAIYAKELTNLEQDQLIRKFTINYSHPTYISADIGHRDSTALWFIQRHHSNTFLITHYYENSGEPWQHYLSYISQSPYNIATLILPHDAKSHSISSSSTIEEQTLSFGLPCEISPKLSIQDGILLTKQLLRKSIFLNSPPVNSGLELLRSYQYNKQQKPKHDHTSHAADSLRYAATYLQQQHQTPTTITHTPIFSLPA